MAPLNRKYKILLLSDDLRMHSGIATMSRELVVGTAHHYDWAQIAGAVKHPENGKVIDLSDATNKQLGISNSYVRLYPTDGYGNEQMLFNVMEIEKPDAIMHFTDPRYWGWLYAVENQIRKKIPLTYLDIWDDLPYPMWNKQAYESCDALFAISKQTDNINKWVLRPEKCLAVDGYYDSTGNLIKY